MQVNRLGELLESEREKRGLSLTEFARDVLKVDQSLISRYINGSHWPSRQTIRKIADALGMTPAAIEALIPDRTRAKAATVDSDARELIRLTVLETIEQMDRRRPRVDPMDNPIHRQMVEEINAQLVTMTLPGIEAALECVVEASRRHFRAEREPRESSK